MSSDFICIPSVRGLILEETAPFVSDTERKRERGVKKIENKDEREKDGVMSVSFLLLLLFLLFSSFYFAKRKLRACLSKHSSIDAFASAALSPEIHMKDTCAFGNSDAQSIFSIVSM